jgi:adenine-specific DNA-methyltransferase
LGQITNKIVDINLRGDSDAFADPPEEFPVFRPVQYLGNKLRTLKMLRSVAEPFIKNGTVCFDLFSGTSVVSQALAALGASVTAIDAQPCCRTMAAAMLAVDRGTRESIDRSSAEEIAATDRDPALDRPWASYAALEAAAIRRRDARALIELYRSLPLVWKSE